MAHREVEGAACRGRQCQARDRTSRRFQRPGQRCHADRSRLPAGPHHLRHLLQAGRDRVLGPAIGARPFAGRLPRDAAPAEPPQQRAELECHVQLAQPVRVGRRHPQVVDLHFHGHIRADRHEFLGEEDLLPVGDQRLAHALGLHLVRVVERGFHRPVLVQQLCRRLRADPRGTRHVVRRVAHQREVVDDPFGRHSELLGGRRFVHPVGRDAGGSPPARVQQPHATAHQLVEVLVAGDDHRLDSLFHGARGQCADHVVGLPSFHLYDATSERLHQLPNPGQALPQLGGHLLPRGLVLRVELLPVAPPRVEDDGQVVGPVRLEDVVEEGREAEGGGRVLALGVGERPIPECVERPVDQGVGVDQEEAGNGLGWDFHGSGKERPASAGAGGAFLLRTVGVRRGSRWPLERPVPSP